MASYAYSIPGSPSRLFKATMVAVGFLLLSDLGYRCMASRYAQVGRSVPLPPGTLAKIPMKIGDWTGTDVPMDQDVIYRTQTDDRINRVYRRGQDEVNFYVAYGVRTRDLFPHRPEVCYEGAGWNLDDQKELNLQGNDEVALPVQIQKFTRGELEKEQVMVLNYYLVNGVYSADVSGLRRDAWRLDKHQSYCAQVQITASTFSNERSELLIGTFAQAAGPFVRDLLKREVEAQQAATKPAQGAAVTLPAETRPSETQRAR